MALTLVDADVLIDAVRQRDPQFTIVREMAARGELAMSTVTMFELLVGATGRAHRERIARYIGYARIVPFDDVVAHRAAEVSRVLRSAGLSIGAPDCMVAGAALVHGLPLLTRNVREFERVPGLAILTVGPSG